MKAKTNEEMVNEALTGVDETTENKPEINLKTNEVQGIEGIGVDDEVEITFKLKCVGKNKEKNMAEVMEVPEGKTEKKPEEQESEPYYNMVFEIIDTKVKGSKGESEEE